MQKLYGMGATVDEAFATLNGGKTKGELGGSLERPPRVRASAVADGYEESTAGQWMAVPATYIETHDFKLEQSKAKQRGKVWLFFKS